MNPARRAPILGVVVLVLVAGAIVDRQVGQSAPGDDAATTGLEVAAPVEAQSSAWYCTGATAEPGGRASGAVVVLNMGARPLRGSVTIVPSAGESRVSAVEAPALGQAVVTLATPAPSPYVAAVVELDGGNAVVELAVNGPLGDSFAPCAPSASPTWYFADGVTTKDATEILSLFNPFPEDAIVDVTFTSEEGQTSPEALSGVTVKGKSVTAVNAGEFVQRREGVTAAVRARSGRLVVHRLLSFDGSEGRRGVSLSLGVRDPGPLWYFPEGVVVDGITERYHVFNPGAQESEISVSFALDSGEAEPLELTVPPESRITVVANDQTRVPRGVGHAVTVESLNGVGVVAERSIDGGPPSGRYGFALTPGAPLAARRWAMAVGRADEVLDEWLVIYNPGTDPIRVSVTLVADGRRQPVAPLENMAFAPGQRRSIRLRDHLQLGNVPLVVSASGPVTVERDIYGGPRTGFSMVLATPLR